MSRVETRMLVVLSGVYTLSHEGVRHVDRRQRRLHYTLHFAYDVEAAERLKCKAARAFNQYEVYSNGAERHVVYVLDPRLYFIFHAADRIKPLPACQPQTA